jgi:simple sugar transport system permease protein
MKVRQLNLRQLPLLAPALIAFAVATIGGALLLLATGHNVINAFTALIIGAFGSLHNISESLLKTVPLLLCGLAVAVAFRAGLWNIGAEGQLLLGALAAAALAPMLQKTPPLLAIVMMLGGGALAGAAWGALPGWMKAHRHVQEVISTILFNFIAIELVRYAVHGPLQEAGGNFPQTSALPETMRLLRFLPPTRLHVGVIVALVAAVATSIFLVRTVAGYQLRALGANPVAARYAGMRIDHLTMLALTISGGIAGLAGAVEYSGVTFRLYENFSPGYGYTAIAVALMGKLNPLTIIGTAFMFGALEAGAGNMQRQANISAVVVEVMQGLVVLSIAATSAYQLRKAKGKQGEQIKKTGEEPEEINSAEETEELQL